MTKKERTLEESKKGKGRESETKGRMKDTGGRERDT